MRWATALQDSQSCRVTGPAWQRLTDSQAHVLVPRPDGPLPPLGRRAPCPAPPVAPCLLWGGALPACSAAVRKSKGEAAGGGGVRAHHQCACRSRARGAGLRTPCSVTGARVWAGGRCAHAVCFVLGPGFVLRVLSVHALCACARALCVRAACEARGADGWAPCDLPQVSENELEAIARMSHEALMEEGAGDGAGGQGKGGGGTRGQDHPPAPVLAKEEWLSRGSEHMWWGGQAQGGPASRGQSSLPWPPCQRTRARPTHDTT